MSHFYVLVKFSFATDRFSARSFPFFVIYIFYTFMSVQQEVSAIIAGVANPSPNNVRASVDRVLQEVGNLLKATQDSMPTIYADVEAASSRDALKKAFARLNGIWGMFLTLQLPPESSEILLEAIASLGVSARMAAFLDTATPLKNALSDYKSAIVTQLAGTIRKREDQRSAAGVMDDELFAKLLPEPTSPVSDTERNLESHMASTLTAQLESSALKRGISTISPITVIPEKRSKIPALANIASVTESGVVEETPKKKILMTREKLRAARLDPKGLLNLIGSSTNALERAKKHELLKTSGYGFNSQGKKSFADKLNAARVRLELGMGAHSNSDTLLFGAQVLNTQGTLSAKNISDVENKVVDANTTWKHQNAYAKQLIAGCLNQARRIIEKYDEVLFGPAPEELVVSTHHAIRGLLDSEDCQEYLSTKDCETEAAISTGDHFVKKIVAAVSPILPITLRNKSLDGSYLRTALHLLGATEFLFAQYEKDIRVQANPAGVVGLSTAMHGEFERTTIWNEELKGFRDFMRDIKTQYQTCYGLGPSFPNDATKRISRRTRNARRAF